MTNYCPYCFGDKSLVRLLERERPKFPDDEKCDFHPTRKAIEGKFVIDLLDRVFRDNYYWSEQSPYLSSGDSLEHLLYEITEADEHEVVSSLIKDLIDSEWIAPGDPDESFYDEDRDYQRAEHHGYNPNHNLWTRFKYEVLHERRFLGTDVTEFLTKIFEEIHWQKDQAKQAAIYEINPGPAAPKIYRARQVNNIGEQEEIRANPALKLGTPPIGFRRANRMNAAGIPAFYAAFDRKTCIAEIRPSVGSVIMSAEFEFIHPIVVLDTTRFEKPAMHRSIFSPVYRKRLDQWQFMQRFMKEISKPILPDDEELEYIPTQIVSEFLCRDLLVTVNGKDCKINGIIFRSAQNPQGKNIVLFGKATRAVDDSQDEADSSPSFNDSYEVFDDYLAGGFGERSRSFLRTSADGVGQSCVRSVLHEVDDYYSQTFDPELDSFE